MDKLVSVICLFFAIPICGYRNASYGVGWCSFTYSPISKTDDEPADLFLEPAQTTRSRTTLKLVLKNTNSFGL
jgi:hypothetical protein